jgi:tellurite resistance protein TehA-like permease
MSVGTHFSVKLAPQSTHINIDLQFYITLKLIKYPKHLILIVNALVFILWMFFIWLNIMIYNILQVNLKNLDHIFIILWSFFFVNHCLFVVVKVWVPAFRYPKGTKTSNKPVACETTSSSMNFFFLTNVSKGMCIIVPCLAGSHRNPYDTRYSCDLWLCGLIAFKLNFDVSYLCCIKIKK